MSKVITFSRTFPAYHPKAGQPTYFVEKFWNNWNQSELDQVFLSDYYDEIKFQLNKTVPFEIICNFFAQLNQCKREDLGAKLHTIRAGNRFKAGEYFSPRVWSGKPYNSKQIIIAPDTLITDVYDFEIKTAYKELPLDYDTDVIINHRIYHTDSNIMKVVAENDGLTLAELLQWFKYPTPFKGQIICWNDKVNYQ